jgi:hypothetical protein
MLARVLGSLVSIAHFSEKSTQKNGHTIRDRDRIYGTVVTRRLRAMGIRDKPAAPASPWQNGVVERLIGSIRRESVDHMIVLGEAHFARGCEPSWRPTPSRIDTS